MSKTTLTRVISIMMLILLGAPIGCVAQETVQTEDVYSGHPLVTTSGEAWVVEVELEGDDYDVAGIIMKENGVLEMYTVSPVFGWQKEEEMRFEVEANKILWFELSDSDDSEPDSELTYSIQGQTLTLIDLDNGETLTFTKKQVDLSRAQLLSPGLEKNVIIYTSGTSVSVQYRSREDSITAVELKIDDKLVEVDKLNSLRNVFYGDYDFEANKTYHVSLVLGTETKTYHESATLIMPQEASIKVEKSDEDNWWDFPIHISWTYPDNNAHSMMLKANVGCENKEECFTDEGLLEPQLREFTIPIGLMNQHSNCDIGVILQNINYVLTDNAYFQATIYSAGIISE